MAAGEEKRRTVYPPGTSNKTMKIKPFFVLFSTIVTWWIIIDYRPCYSTCIYIYTLIYICLYTCIFIFNLSMNRNHNLYFFAKKKQHQRALALDAVEGGLAPGSVATISINPFQVGKKSLIFKAV